MSSRKPLFLFSTSDNHIGYLSVEQMTKEYYDEDYGFFAMVEELIEVNEIDNVALAITGDFFDHQLSLNSQHSLFAMDLIHSMLNFFVRKHKGEVILIRGTRSHDLNQLSIFEPFVSEFKGKFKILNTVEEIDIAGYATLCIPEEYMKNQEEYYEPYFSKQYDLILGHGFFKYNCFNKNEVERPVPGMPIFDQDQFCDMARLTIFGHDHRHQNYKDQIYYNGSYSRNVHGEEDAKGFLLSYISDDEIDVNHIENELALTFHTAFLHKVVEGELDYEKCVKAINALKKEVDFLKIKIDKATVMEYPTMVELIVSLFNTQLKRGIMIESPTFTRKDGELVLLAEDMNSDSDAPSVREDSKYSFLFDEGNVDDKILKYLEIKHGDKLVDDMSIDEVRLAISELDKE